MNILLTGGAGYIGSHTLIELDKAGHSVVVVDNFYNSQPEAIRRVEKIIGHKVIFYEADIRDREAMDKVFTDHKIDAVINFAGLKAVGESVAKPLMYYETNMNGLFVLVDVMAKHGCKNIIFSSSATVYGDPAIIPITEECPKGQCTNPYGWTKSMIEQVLMDVQKADRPPSAYARSSASSATTTTHTTVQAFATTFMLLILLLVMYARLRPYKRTRVLPSTTSAQVMAIPYSMLSRPSRRRTD